MTYWTFLDIKILKKQETHKLHSQKLYDCTSKGWEKIILHGLNFSNHENKYYNNIQYTELKKDKKDKKEEGKEPQKKKLKTGKETDEKEETDEKNLFDEFKAKFDYEFNNYIDVATSHGVIHNKAENTDIKNIVDKISGFVAEDCISKITKLKKILNVQHYNTLYTYFFDPNLTKNINSKNLNYKFLDDFSNLKKIDIKNTESVITSKSKEKEVLNSEIEEELTVLNYLKSINSEIYKDVILQSKKDKDSWVFWQNKGFNKFILHCISVGKFYESETIKEEKKRRLIDTKHRNVDKEEKKQELQNELELQKQLLESETKVLKDNLVKLGDEVLDNKSKDLGVENKRSKRIKIEPAEIKIEPAPLYYDKQIEIILNLSIMIDNLTELKEQIKKKEEEKKLIIMKNDEINIMEKNIKNFLNYLDKDYMKYKKEISIYNPSLSNKELFEKLYKKTEFIDSNIKNIKYEFNKKHDGIEKISQEISYDKEDHNQLEIKHNEINVLSSIKNRSDFLEIVINDTFKKPQIVETINNYICITLKY